MTTTLTPTLTTHPRDNVIWSHLSLGLVIIVGLFVHSYNMFGYPLYLGDEGIYMSQAYAVVKLGQITPYTYWYDHAPAGWLLIAIWSAFTGGFGTFGTAIDSGRVLMLLLHIISLFLMFRIILQLTSNSFAATIVGLVYALSPLTIIYGRMVLLDNMMVFWALVATWLLLQHNGKIWPLFFSGFWFGVAVLTKENAILLIPAFLYGLWTLINKSHGRFARAAWLFATIATISLYPLYAALRAELIDLNLSSPLAGQGSSVSLIGSMLWQVGRSDGAPWDPTSDFFQLLTTNWLVKDPWILALGAVATLWNLCRNDPSKRLIALLSLGAVISIAHGIPAFEFYIISVLPFFALNIGLAIVDLAKLLRSPSLLPMASAAVIAIGWFNLDHQRNIFTLNLTTIQRQALDWMQEHVPAQAQIVTDDDLWVDLRAGAPHHPGFPGAHSHWKVANDPAVSNDLFYNDWQSLDYLILTPGLDQIFENDRDKLTHQAYTHSTPVASFNVGQAIVEIRKVNHAGLVVKEMLTHSYNGFKSRYIDQGQVRSERGYTSARDQATALLMAVWMDDKTTFNELWDWTYVHLQSETGLLYHTNEPGVTLHSTTDADTDVALALLLAERRWSDASYGRHAKRIIEAIWEHEVVELKGKPYLAAGNWAVSKDTIIFAPATFVPYAYHLFAAADPEHNWWYLLDTNYQLLADVSSDSLGEQRSAGLPPAYVGIDRDTGVFLPNPVEAPPHGNTFDEWAAQTYWRVGLDAQWHDDGRADSFLTASRFLQDEWVAKSKLAARYIHRGKQQTNNESLILYSAVLPKFLIENPEAAHQLYATKLATVYTQTYHEGRWGDGTDIAQERWAWLATGLYANALPYRWDVDKVASPTPWLPVIPFEK